MRRGRRETDRRIVRQGSGPSSAIAVAAASCRLRTAAETFRQVPNEVTGPAAFIAPISGSAPEEPYRQKGEGQIRDAHRDEGVDVATRGETLAGAHQGIV